jgi:phosphohistidine phosphatase
MTKHLILFRHGKSDWGAGSGRDRDRPVAPRGIAAAKTMGKLLATAGKVPDLAITSAAVRARTTLESLPSRGLELPSGNHRRSLRSLNPQVLEVIHRVADHHSSLMLVGHQPTWSDAVTYFTGGGAVHMPTAVMACLEFEVNTWREVEAGRGTLLWLLPPRLFT